MPTPPSMKTPKFALLTYVKVRGAKRHEPLTDRTHMELGVYDIRDPPLTMCGHNAGELIAGQLCHGEFIACRMFKSYEDANALHIAAKYMEKQNPYSGGAGGPEGTLSGTVLLEPRLRRSVLREFHSEKEFGYA